MRRHGLAYVAGLLGGAGLVGCEHTKTYETDVPMVEEWRTAPDEERFNHPPERKWEKPPPKKEFRPGMGAGAGGMGGPAMGGAPGMGGF